MMLSKSESAAILHYVRELRRHALEDKRLAASAFNASWCEHWLSERRRHLKEAWRWRRNEREFREDTIKALLRSQLKHSLMMEAAE